MRFSCVLCVLVCALSCDLSTNLFAANPTYPAANGAYGGIDELQRLLPLEQPDAPLPKADRYAGLFYFTWLAQHGKDGPYDITKIMKDHPAALLDTNHSAWGPLSAFHHWGESIFGYYTSDDAWVKRKHIQMLTDAGVDFLIFDATNASPYLDQVMPLLSIMDEYQKQGWVVPKIVFYTNSASGQTIEKAYEGLYKKNLYPNLWFMWEGKPMIVGHPEECSNEIKAFFRIKKSQWPNEGKFHDDGLPWIAFERPQHVFKNAKGENESINVSVAQHNGTIRFSSSAFYGDQTNWTRSFHDGKNDPAPEAFKYGYNFAEQCKRALEQDPKIVFITGWNEWIAMRFNGPKNEPVMFVDLCDTNNSRDIEPMVGGFGDNYYMQMIDFIRKYKGITPPQNAASDSVSIKIDGDFSQWNQIKTEYRDYVNDAPNRDVQGYGKLHYTNNTGRNDFDVMKVAEDKTNYYFYVRTVKPITAPGDNHWMSLFLRTSDSTKDKSWEAKSWKGYDFVLNRVAPKEGKAVLESTTGGWNWKEAATVSMKVEGNQLQLAVPKKMLGETGKPLQFKWADNYQGEGNIFSFYTDGDAAPLGRLNYTYQ